MDLQAVLPAWDPAAAVHLRGLEVLGTQPVFVDSLCKRKRDREGKREREIEVSKNPLQLVTSLALW